MATTKKRYQNFDEADMKNTPLTDEVVTVTHYEELIRRVAKEIGMPIWAKGSIEEICRDMEEQNNEVLIALDVYWKNLQACESDSNMEKITIRDLARRRLYAAINSAKQA